MWPARAIVVVDVWVRCVELEVCCEGKGRGCLPKTSGWPSVELAGMFVVVVDVTGAPDVSLVLVRLFSCTCHRAAPPSLLVVGQLGCHPKA